jgi:hypothetical protein
MEKRIIVELDDDGVIVAVYCPDETYVVDILESQTYGSSELADYYAALESEKENLKNCF